LALFVGTLVSQCTHAAVLAGVVVCLVQTALARIAGIDGANVAVVAVDRGPPCACSGVALLTHGTGIPIVAGGAVEGMNAAQCRRAGIVSARVLVLAIDGDRARTLALATGLSRGAHVAVVAPAVCGQMLTPRFGHAGIRSTRVVVFALGLLNSHLALAGLAVVTDGTQVAVRA